MAPSGESDTEVAIRGCRFARRKQSFPRRHPSRSRVPKALIFEPLLGIQEPWTGTVQIRRHAFGPFRLDYLPSISQSSSCPKRFPGCHIESASPKHLPFRLCKCRISASRRLNVFLQPPIIGAPSKSMICPCRTTSTGTPRSIASGAYTPQHTHIATSALSVCVLIWRLKSGERRLCWT